MKNKNLDLKKDFKKYSKIYNGGYAKRKRRLNGFLKHLIFFIIVAVVSYFLCVMIYSFVKREHKTSVSIPDSYGEEGKKQNLNSNSLKKQKEEKIFFEALELPKNLIFKEDEVRAFFKKAKKKGKNSVVVTVKDELGNLLYNSNVEEAKSWETIVKKPVDLKKIVKIAKEENLNLTAKVNCFLDPKAADPYFENTFVYKNDPDNIYKFQDKQTYKNKIYLNPFYDSTKEYFLNIAKELYGLGFKNILLLNFCFPQEELNSKIKDYSEIKKNVVLKNLLENLKKTKANIILEYDFEFLSEDEKAEKKMYNCFGENILNFDLKLNCVVVKTNKELKAFLNFFNKFKEKNKQKDFILKLEFNPTEEEIKKLKEKGVGFYIG